MPRPGQNNLLYTLVSSFRAASKAEQKHLSVLVHLAVSDLTRLQETIVRTSSLFSSQISAGQLILIGAALDASPTVAGTTDSALSGESYFKQSTDHAFLRSFAQTSPITSWYWRTTSFVPLTLSPTCFGR